MRQSPACRARYLFSYCRFAATIAVEADAGPLRGLAASYANRTRRYRLYRLSDVCVCVCVWAAAGQTDDLPGTVAVRNSVTAGK